MKKLITLSVLTLALLAPLKNKACVDYHNTIFATCDYSANFQEILITVHNMELFGGPQGAFCTCAIDNYTTLFSNIQYVAFVDSNTLNPVPGFDPWSANANASNGWSNAQSGSWDGFLSEVNSMGILTGVPVELVIRASPPPGFTFNALDSSLVASSLGTDEFNNTTQDLANSHNSISSFVSGGPITYNVQPLTYFESVDSQVLSLNSVEINSVEVSIFPNPANESIYFELSDMSKKPEKLELYDQFGKLVLKRNFAHQVDISTLPHGLYYVKVLSDGVSAYLKLVKE